ncbi:MAG: hypothetical protein IPN76_05785 [Saprospiraceae bacterium]|nr:hypothetical protein [Saprospiraceae bacterium]
MNGVYKVELKRRDGRYDRDTNIKEWRLKEATFFPDKWDWWRLYEECEFAFDNKSFVGNKGTKSSLDKKLYKKSNVLLKFIRISMVILKPYPLFLEFCDIYLIMF